MNPMPKTNEGWPPLQAMQIRYPASDHEIDGATWTVRDTAPGSQLPLVLLPGAGGTGDVFHRVLAAFGETQRLITVRYPALDDARALEDGIWKLLDRLQLLRVDLLGSSLGGYLAQACAASHPGRLRRVLFSSTFFDATWLRKKIPPDTWAATPADELMRRARAGWEAAPEGADGERDLKRTLLALIGTEQSAETAKASLLAVLRSAPLPRTDLADVDIALIDADDDPVVDAPTRQALRNRYAHSPQWQLARGGHYPALLVPQEFLAAVCSHFGFAPT